MTLSGRPRENFIASNFRNIHLIRLPRRLRIRKEFLSLAFVTLIFRPMKSSDEHKSDFCSKCLNIYLCWNIWKRLMILNYNIWKMEINISLKDCVKSADKKILFTWWISRFNEKPTNSIPAVQYVLMKFNKIPRYQKWHTAIMNFTRPV